MHELQFITNMVEEQLVKGNLRWLANFNEIHKDYRVADTVFPIYASGSLREKGFFLSKIYSALVTPKYKIHFLLYTSQEIDTKSLRQLILSCKSKFGSEDWIFLSLVQTQPFERNTKQAITNTADRTVGIAAYSLSSKETVTSDNVLGKGLAKQLRLTEAKFEVFDLPSYLKSFTIVFSLGILLLVVLALSGLRTAIQPLTLLLMATFSLIVGYRIYKTRYHTSLTLNGKGFKLSKGNTVEERRWADFKDVSIYITSQHETCIRLQSKEETFDLPLSRAGISRKEAYSTIRQLIMRQ